MATRIKSSKINWGKLYRYYKEYAVSGEKIRESAGSVIRLRSSKLSDKVNDDVNTCAIRLSYAIHRCGIRLPYIKGRCWKYVGKYDGPAWLPSYAADYRWLLIGERLVKSYRKMDLVGKQGIILLYVPPGQRREFGASGHVTVFQGLNFLDGSNYWGRAEVTKRLAWFL